MAYNYIDHNKNFYELDYFEIDNGGRIPALTVHNTNFLEKVIQLDSRYKFEQDIIKPSANIRKLKNISDILNYTRNYISEKDKNIFSTKVNNKNYIGSIKYWFKRLDASLKKKSINYAVCIIFLLLNINLTNSTRHSYKEVIITALKIIQKYNTPECLIDNLLKQKSKIDSECILYDLTNKIGANEFSKIERIYNLENYDGFDFDIYDDSFKLSLASKFCSYACEYLKDLIKAKIEYSKYDKIVSNNLHFYIKFYVSADATDVNNKTFSIENKKRINDLIHIYNIYSGYINNIISNINSGKSEIYYNKNKFDHVIWYSNK